MIRTYEDILLPGTIRMHSVVSIQPQPLPLTAIKTPVEVSPQTGEETEDVVVAVLVGPHHESH